MSSNTIQSSFIKESLLNGPVQKKEEVPAEKVYSKVDKMSKTIAINCDSVDLATVKFPKKRQFNQILPTSWRLNSIKKVALALLSLGGILALSTINSNVKFEHYAPSPVKDLQQEVALASRVLSLHCVLPEWPHVDDKCYEIAGLETSIARLMIEARPFLSQTDQDAAKCGTKHLNLIKQAQLVDGLKLEGVVVPVPHGVGTDHVEQLLRKLAPEVFEEWSQLGTLYANFNGTTPFLEHLEAKCHLQAIDRAIEKAFQAAGKNKALFQELVPPNFKAWLKTIKANGNYLMVRSTASEDSRETANAGGNDSCNYVSPTTGALAKAMGDVVRSYFSYDSLQNRINANMNPFQSELKMAVTVQELIGEQIGGSSNPAEIPISLVLFSSEPLYVDGEKFRVMRMSIAYGHGEGVVGNQGIATDTALLLISQAHPDKLYILYDNKPKPERLGPISTPEGIKLGKVFNPLSMQNRPALDEALLHRLYLWGVIGEKFFDDHPTDMEIVVKGGTIFPVQARPINRQDLLPTYLDLKKVAALPQSPITQKIQGETFVSGQSSVVIIERSEELLFASTLEEAERMFQKGLHKIVAVTRPEPANSHPVVNFSGLGIPCLTAPNGVLELLKQMDAEHHIVVDVQTGVLNLWNTPLGAISGCISKGFAVHPAKITISQPLAANLPIRQEGQKVPQEIKDLILDIRSAATQGVAAAKLKELRRHGWIQNMKDREEELKKHLQQLKFVPRQLWQGLILSTQLIEKMEAAFEEAEAVLAKNSQERLHSLFHAKVIESLIIKTPQTERSLGQYTVVDIEPLHADLKTLIDYQKSLSHPAHFADLLMFGSQGIVPIVKTEWMALLKELEPLVESEQISPEQVQKFKQMIATLDMTGILPTWYSLFFPQVSQSNLAPQEKLNKLLETFPAKEAPFLHYFLDIHRTLQASQGNIDLLTHPKSFEKRWTWLQSQVNQLLSQTQVGASGSLAEQLKNSAPVSKILALKVMKDLVDTYDLSIKAIKASPTWNEHEKVHLFKRMLEPYLNLLLDWGKGVVDPAAVPMHKYWSLSKYLDSMEGLFKNLGSSGDPKHLRPSPSFSVVEAMIGSGTGLCPEHAINYPRHLEDMFTLIHQNLLKILSSLSNQLYDDTIVQQALLPDLLKEMSKTIPAKLEYPRMIQRVGLEISAEAITIKYNIPLNYHAAQMWFNYEQRSGEVTFKGVLLGPKNNPHTMERWETYNNFLWILDKLGFLSLSEPIYKNDQEISFSWRMQDSQTLLTAIEEWNLLLKMSSYPHLRYMIEGLFKRHGITSTAFKKLLTSIIKEGKFSILLEPKMAEEIFAKNDPEINTLFITAVNTGIRDASYIVVSNALLLLEPFFEKGEGVLESITSANKGIIDPSWVVRRNSINVLEALVKKGQGCPEAARAAISLVGDDNEEVRRSAINLLKILFEKGKVEDETAKTAVSKGIKDSDWLVRAEAIDLYTVLVEQSKGDDNEVIRVAIQEMLGSNGNRARKLWRTLLKQQKGHNEAITFVSNVINDYSYDKDVRLTVIFFMTDILKEGIGEDEARIFAKIASEQIKNSDHNIRSHARTILKDLIEAGMDEKVAFALKESLNMEITDSSLLFYALDVLVALAKKGRNCELETVRTAINNNQYNDIREMAEELDKILKAAEADRIIESEGLMEKLNRFWTAYTT